MTSSTSIQSLKLLDLTLTMSLLTEPKLIQYVLKLLIESKLILGVLTLTLAKLTHDGLNLTPSKPTLYLFHLLDIGYKQHVMDNTGLSMGAKINTSISHD